MFPFDNFWHKYIEKYVLQPANGKTFSPSKEKPEENSCKPTYL
jgi:hypothetical protein